jgi:mono/diheme cytochrome c family protein
MPTAKAGENLMKIIRLVAISSAFALAGFGTAAHADGKATFTNVCSECHEAGDFEGEDAKELSANIKKIVAGQMKHKKALKLTDQEITDVTAYLVGGGK